MTYGAFTQDFAPYEAVRRPSKPIPQSALCAIILALSTTAGLWALYARPFATQASAPDLRPIAALGGVITPIRVVPAPTAPRWDVAAATAPTIKKTTPRDPALLYPSLTSGYVAATFTQSAPLHAAFELSPQRLAAAVAAMPTAAAPSVVPALPALPAVVSPLVADVPMPMPRPSDLLVAPGKVPAKPHDPQVAALPQSVAPAPAAPQGFFEKMFGNARPAGTALAYAAPDDGGSLGNLFGSAARRPAAYDRWTAIYDITAHTVYLPDGTRLEAHSGLGTSKDNPSSVAEHMRGVTPPNLYDLTPREALFHGVRALRLTPLGGTTYGRAGLLTHTYMLRGRAGESNGCVVFRDYEAFLRAYDSGAIRRLAVVARLN